MIGRLNRMAHSPLARSQWRRPNLITNPLQRLPNERPLSPNNIALWLVSARSLELAERWLSLSAGSSSAGGAKRPQIDGVNDRRLVG